MRVGEKGRETAWVRESRIGNIGYREVVCVVLEGLCRNATTQLRSARPCQRSLGVASNTRKHVPTHMPARSSPLTPQPCSVCAPPPGRKAVTQTSNPAPPLADWNHNNTARNEPRTHRPPVHANASRLRRSLVVLRSSSSSHKKTVTHTRHTRNNPRSEAERKSPKQANKALWRSQISFF